jgi:hypothetical protein
MEQFILKFIEHLEETTDSMFTFLANALKGLNANLNLKQTVPRSGMV